MGVTTSSLSVVSSENIPIVDMSLFRVLPPLAKMEGKPLVLGPGMLATEGFNFYACNQELLGTPIQYGFEMVLVHAISSQILAPNFEKGARKTSSRIVTLSTGVGERSSICEIAPFDNRTRYHNGVDLSKPSHLIFSDAHKIRYQLGYDPSSENSLTVSLEESCWSIKLYSPFAPDSDRILHYGSIVTISSSKLRALLTAHPLYDKEFIPVPDIHTQEAELAAGGDVDLPSVMQNTYRMALTYEPRDYNAYWTFEKEDRYEGGAVIKGEPFWLRHAATQRYLSPDGRLTSEKSEANTITIMTTVRLEENKDDAGEDEQSIVYTSIVQFLTGEQAVLVPDREESAKFVWSALFGKRLQQHEEQRYEVYQPAAFKQTGAQREDVDFEVNQPEVHISECFLQSLVLRPSFSKYRLFYRRLDALVKTFGPNEDAMFAEMQSLQIYYHRLLVLLAEHEHLEEMQDIFYALGYHFDLGEALVLRRKKTDQSDHRTFILSDELEEEFKPKASEGLPRVRDMLAGTEHILYSEITPLLLKKNHYVCARILEDSYFLPALINADAGTTANMLDYALEGGSPSMKAQYEYMFLYHDLLVQKSSDNLVVKSCFKILATLFRRMEGSLDTNAKDLLYYKTAEGNRELIFTFSGNPQTPFITFLNRQIVFFPKRRPNPDFYEGLRVAESITCFLIAVCKATPLGHKELANDLNLTPDFLKTCIDEPRIELKLQIQLEALYVNLFLRGESIADTVSEKIKIMCFIESDIRMAEDKFVSPLETDCTDPIIREAIQNEFVFWLSSEPNGFLMRALSSEEMELQRTVWILTYIRSHIQAVSYLIEWKRVNDIFVYAIRKALTVVLGAFDPTLKKGDRLKHWSQTVMDFVFVYFQTKVEAEAKSSVSGDKGTPFDPVEKRWKEQEGDIESNLETTEADVNWSIGETYKSILDLYRLITHHFQLSATYKTLVHISQEPDWQSQLSNPQQRDILIVRYSEYFKQLYVTSSKGKLLKFLGTRVQREGVSAQDPLLSAVGGATTLFSEHSVKVAEKKWDLKGLLKDGLLVPGERYVKFSREVLHLLRLVSNPLQAFFEHFKKAVFVEESSLGMIQSIMEKFKTCSINMKSIIRDSNPDSLSTVEAIIHGLEDICHIFVSIQHSSLTREDQRTIINKVQVVFTNTGLDALLKELWELSSLLDIKGFEHVEVTIKLKTMTLMTTQYYVRSNPHLLDHMMSFMHQSNFFMDYPEYIELLAETRLLKESSHDAIFLYASMLVAALKTEPKRLRRIEDCLALMCADEHGTLWSNLQIVAVVVSNSLNAALSAEAKDPHEIAVLLRVLTYFATLQPALRTSIFSMFSIDTLIAAKLAENMPIDLLTAWLEYAAEMYPRKPEDFMTGSPAMDSIYSVVCKVLREIASRDPSQLLSAVTTGDVPMTLENSQKPQARCQRNLKFDAGEELNLMQFLFHVDRRGKGSGFVVDSYRLLKDIPMLPEVRIEELIDAESSLVAVYGKISSDAGSLAVLHPLLSALHTALKSLKSDLIFGRDSGFNFEGVFEAMTDPLNSIPEDCAAVSVQAVAVTPVFRFNDSLEEQLKCIIKLLPFLAHKTTDHFATTIALFKEHLESGRGENDDLVGCFMKYGPQTKRIFDEGKDPSIDLRIKSSMIEGLNSRDKAQLYSNNIFWLFLENRVLRSLKSPKEDIRLFALKLFNAILAEQGVEFRRKVLEFLNTRQRYSDVFIRFGFAISHYEQLALYSPHLGSESNKAEIRRYSEYLREFFIFVQHCCDDCFSDFQCFMEVQNESSSSNQRMVSRMREFIVNIWLRSYGKVQPVVETIEMTKEALNALQEALSGPNTNNQNLLGNSKELYLALNNILAFCRGKETTEQEGDLCIEVLKLLDTLLEGHKDDTMYLPLMRQALDCEAMLNSLVELHGKVSNMTPHEFFGNRVSATQAFEVGRKQMIILLQISKRSDCTLMDMLSTQRLLNPAEVFFLNNVSAVEILGRDERIYDAYFPLPIEANYLTEKSSLQIISEIKRDSQQAKVDQFIEMRRSCKREMQHQMLISKCGGLKAVSRWWKEAQHASFLMIVVINLLLLIEFGAEDPEQPGGRSDCGFFDRGEDCIRFKLPGMYAGILTVLGLVQVVFMIIGRLLYWIEYGHTLWYPLFEKKAEKNTKAQYTDPKNKSQNSILLTDSYTKMTIQIEATVATQQSEEQRLKAVSEAAAPVSQPLADLQSSRIEELADEAAELCVEDKVAPVKIDAKTTVVESRPPLDCDTITHLIWHTVFIALCIIAYWAIPEIYPLLLLELASLNVDMRNILKAVTQNSTQLILTALFTISMVFIFTTWAYVFFHGYYTNDKNLFCENLYDCFFSTLNVGVRSGAIGEAMDPYTSGDYYHRMMFDMLFFIIIIVILLNIVFGIIVDTFGQLRDDRNMIETDINNVCFVCGEERSLIDMHGEEWETHITVVHSPFAYMAFMIYVETKKEEDCSGLELFVFEELRNKSSNFMPDTSQALMKAGVGNRAGA